MTHLEKENMISQWLKNEIKEEELLDKLPKEELDGFKAILDTVDNWVPQGSEEAKLDLNAILASKKEAKVVSFYQTNWFIGIAASITLLIGVYFFLNFNQTQTFYADNENLEILLPDNSTSVTLAPGAKLTYKAFDKEDRKVTLSGRAYFDVTEKGPFKVTFERGELSVLGTQFELDHSQEEVITKCFEGKVEVVVNDQKVSLEKGSIATFNNSKWTSGTLIGSSPVWLDGLEEHFDDASLSKVLEILALRYGVTFETNGLAEKRNFTGNVPLDDLEKACRLIFVPLNINYTIDQNQVILSE